MATITIVNPKAMAHPFRYFTHQRNIYRVSDVGYWKWNGVNRVWVDGTRSRQWILSNGFPISNFRLY